MLPAYLVGRSRVAASPPVGSSLSRRPGHRRQLRCRLDDAARRDARPTGRDRARGVRRSRPILPSRPGRLPLPCGLRRFVRHRRAGALRRVCLGAAARSRPRAIGPINGLLAQAGSLGSLAGPPALALWVEITGWAWAPLMLLAVAVVGAISAGAQSAPVLDHHHPDLARRRRETAAQIDRKEAHRDAVLHVAADAWTNPPRTSVTTSQWFAVLSIRRRAVRESAWRQVGPAVPVQTRSPCLGAYSSGACSAKLAPRLCRGRRGGEILAVAPDPRESAGAHAGLRHHPGHESPGPRPARSAAVPFGMAAASPIVTDPAVQRLAALAHALRLT